MQVADEHKLVKGELDEDLLTANSKLISFMFVMPHLARFADDIKLPDKPVRWAIDATPEGCAPVGQAISIHRSRPDLDCNLGHLAILVPHWSAETFSRPAGTA